MHSPHLNVTSLANYHPSPMATTFTYQYILAANYAPIHYECGEKFCLKNCSNVMLYDFFSFFWHFLSIVKSGLCLPFLAIILNASIEMYIFISRTLLQRQNFRLERAVLENSCQFLVTHLPPV